MTEKYNPHIQDLVAKLPGVHSKNLRSILNKGVSLNHLIKLTKVIIDYTMYVIIEMRLQKKVV